MYVPASYVQNPLPRSINILIVNDGTPYFLKELAFGGGLDHALLTGVVPETVLIGLPQSVTDCQRQYELTFSEDPKFVGLCHGHARSGGTDLYFAFIRDQVVPLVTAALRVYAGEISMTGVSYGGLTACYAAAAQPAYFRRVFCQSPSLNWHYGELAAVVKANVNADAGSRPVAVVMYTGSIEMGSPIPTRQEGVTKTTFQYINDTAAAFAEAGGGAIDLHFFTLAGGQHDAASPCFLCDWECQ